MQISVTSPLVTIYCVFENNYIVLIIRLLVRSYDKEHLPKRNKKMHNNVGKDNNNKMLNKIPQSEQLKNLFGKSKKRSKIGDTSNTNMHDCSLSMLDTCKSI